MKVKVGDKTHDGAKEPIMFVFESEDELLELIAEWMSK